MSNKKDLKIYIIRHKESGKHWTAPSGKSSWKAIGHAKNAWATLCSHYHTHEHYSEKYGVPLVLSNCGNSLAFPRFDQQNVYEIVEVNNLAREIVSELKIIIEQLIELIPDIDKKEYFLQKYKELKGND